MTLKSLTENLNPTQKEAVEHHSGPMLILAGAGSGKTRVLTHRVASIILAGEAAPNEVLAVTFTNKAAKEMKSRIEYLLRSYSIPVFDDLWVSTFHSICAKILRQQITLLGYAPSFTIYDDSDQLAIIKKVLTSLNINDKIFPPKSFKAKINAAKNLGLNPDAITAKAPGLMDTKAQMVYSSYENMLKLANALDFSDLLMKTYEVFQSYPAILEQYQQKFRFVMVDEYQDTNHIQYLIVKMLSSQHQNLCVVGDEDQSIYSWRGADINNILDFEKDFPNTKVVKLEENYRSTQNIINAASHLIKHNTIRKGKTLFTNNPKGSLITVREEMNDTSEAKFVGQKIYDLIQSGKYEAKDFAIFYRTNAQSRLLEEQMRIQSLPYQLVGGMRFYDRAEVKDMVCYLKVILNPADEVSAKRIINTPPRGIGKTTVNHIDTFAATNNITFLAACEHCHENEAINAGAKKKVKAFHDMMSFFSQEQERVSLLDLYHTILDYIGYITKLKAENTTEAEARINNLEEFSNAISQFEQERGDEASLLNFLEEMALISDADRIDTKVDGVTLMTLHVSKGLEFSNVFMVGVEEGLFPSAMKFHADPSEMEEERRLAYVGMTRAKENLFLVHAKFRRVWGQEQCHTPSRFISEIPQEFVTHESNISSLYKDKSKDQDFSQETPYDTFDSGPTDQAHAFRNGLRVKHPTFGIGTIFSVQGKGDNLKVGVTFGNRTMKTFIAKYARLERA